MNRLKLITFYLILVPLVFNACSADSPKYIKELKYFKILANAEDDPLFVKIQNEFDIYPLMTNYIIIVDIQDASDANKKIIIGDPEDPSHIARPWNSFSKEVRDGLLKWDGSNKFKM